MNQQEIEEQLIKHEGFENKIYYCSMGKPTIGVGRNIENYGLSEEEIYFMLRNDIKKCTQDLNLVFDNFNDFDDILQHALIDMRFNLGYSGFRKFKKMIKAIKNKNLEEAAEEAIDSRWYHQVRGRSKSIVSMIRGGYIS